MKNNRVIKIPKKKNKTILWALLIIVPIVDIMLTITGIVPGAGDVTAISGNFVTEIIQFAIVLGLVKK